MQLIEKGITFNRTNKKSSLLEHFRDEVNSKLKEHEYANRFVVTETTKDKYVCELGTIVAEEKLPRKPADIFEYRQRKHENQDQFNAVVLVPTGIGAQLGGHSGDGGAMIRLLSSVCDNVITHPNVVNAADINELPDNTLYVEGSIISRFMMGSVGLQKVRSNRILFVVDEHPENDMFHDSAINAVSAARVALGLDCAGIVKMKTPIHMEATFSKSGSAVGRIEHLERLLKIIESNQGSYDAIALNTIIKVPKHFHSEYFEKDLEVNPWGGVEAMLTHSVSSLYNIPSAHSPMMSSTEVYNLNVGIVEPRKAAESVSITYLHCILKGLHRSPRIIETPTYSYQPGVMTVEDVSCMVIPEKCLGLPTLAALEQGIHVIAVKENSNCMKNNLNLLPFRKGFYHEAENYMEAVGIMSAIKAGVAPDTVRRPINLTEQIEIMSDGAF